MRRIIQPFSLFFLLACCSFAHAQMDVTTNSNAIALAQRIAGEGVAVSNVSLTGNANMTGFFKNLGNNKIAIDSGIILTNGRAKTVGSGLGMDGSGNSPALNVLADNGWNRAGDADLAAAIGVAPSDGKDACVLEFDFVPQGEKIQFNYVFSSEEYSPNYVCLYNDAFAFFISGPGITGKKNIALIPNTSTPVSIFNVNNVAGGSCPNNIKYYVDNTAKRWLTHNGHTTLLTAESEVQPCQTYHLKLVVMDVGDDKYDSGVFLQAKSLVSEPLRIDNQNPLNDLNQPYLAEGCRAGAIHITRQEKKPYPQAVNLHYGGTATNGADVVTLPSLVTIPANDSVVVVPIVALADLVPEGIEKLKIYVSAGCANSYSDSLELEIRDIDLLSITPADSVSICRNGSVQLQAVTGYTIYSWTGAAGLDNTSIANPLATPAGTRSTYICTATFANCIAKDSVLVKWKTVEVESKTDVNCKDGLTGQITVKGRNWETPVTYSVDDRPYQASASLQGLGAGSHIVRIKDVSGCIDSVQVDLVQSYPDLTVDLSKVDASCSIVPDGQIIATATGGNGSYTYSLTGNSYQPGNTFIVPQGNHHVQVKDGNGCTMENVITVGLNNTVTIDAGPDATICEGTTQVLNANSNATGFAWTPAVSLNNAGLLQPTASPSDTTRYYVTATLGVCSRIDSVDINVRPAPTANAGQDIAICYGKTVVLEGGGGTSYEWSPATNTVSGLDNAQLTIKGLQSINYYLNVTDAHGCKSLQPDMMQVKVTPPLKLFAGNDTILTMNEPIKLRGQDLNNSGITQWNWSPVNNLDNASTQSPLAMFATPVLTYPYDYVYTLTGTTPEGCEGKDEIRIKVIQGPEIYVPTGFTPNNDGKNDQLKPVLAGIKELRFFKVYNRWGQPVFQTKDASRGWDGKLNGMIENNGSYVWLAEGVDFKGNIISRKGSTTLVR